MPALLCLPQNVPKLWIRIAAPITHTQRPSNVSQQNDDGQMLKFCWTPTMTWSCPPACPGVPLFIYIVPQPPPGNNYYWKHSFDLICRPTKRFSNYSNYAPKFDLFPPPPEHSYSCPFLIWSVFASDVDHHYHRMCGCPASDSQPRLLDVPGGYSVLLYHWPCIPFVTWWTMNDQIAVVSL